MAASVSKPNVRFAPGVYTAALTLDRTVSIHGAGATLLATLDGPNLRVIDAAVARVYDLSIVNNNTAAASVFAQMGIYCASEDNINRPKLSLKRVVIDANRRPMHINDCGVIASQTTLRAPRTTDERYLFMAANGGSAAFDRGQFIGGGSIASLSASITITNSILDGQLGAPTEGALIAVAGSISVSYSTIFNSPLLCSAGESPACASAARTGVCIENSIVNKPSSLSDSLPGDKCRCDYCIVSPQQSAVVGSNNLIGENPDFKDPATSDFHLKLGSPAINAAHPSIPGTADYDGVARPQNGRSDLGAFEFKP
ncbi:MAG: hypothetical protein M4D80_02405 [Myxococcota bacterium]|nr:hypothetical protein [Deltaproteobacteria bacterium]MDQ3333985.1 hypothetical protein [Myxococcota bacterium]